MTEHEYTPSTATTDDVFSWLSSITSEEEVRAVRRWLAEHDRQVQAEALEQLVERVTDDSLVQVFGGEKFVSVPLLVSEAQAIREARSER